MLNISRTRLLAAALGCLAIAATSVSLADDQPGSTQAAQPVGPSLAAAGAAQQQPASPPNEQPSTVDQQPSLSPPSSDSQPTNNQAKASSANEWPSPRRYDSNNPQGGSLGVNIISDRGGIIISSVRSGTPAQQMGLRQRDRIQSVNGQPVEAVDQFISMIRNMNAGDQVEIEIVRDDAPNKLSGKLEAFGQALARGTDLNSENEPGMSRSGRFSNRLADNSANPNVQAGYEERTQPGRQPSGDVEERLTNLEQQLSKLQQDIADIRAAIGNKPKSETSGTKTPAAGTIGNPSPRTPSVFRPTPGQPPSAR